jgi:hypothetical protein
MWGSVENLVALSVLMGLVTAARPWRWAKPVALMYMARLGKDKDGKLPPETIKELVRGLGLEPDERYSRSRRSQRGDNRRSHPL